MNKNDVLQLIDVSPSVTKEVFSSIVGSDSKATRDAAITQSSAVVKKIMEKESLFNSVDQYLLSTPLDYVVAFANEAAAEMRKTIKHKLLVEPFMDLWIGFFAFLYDLNAEKIKALKDDKSPEYHQVGEGMFLAGLYLLLN